MADFQRLIASDPVVGMYVSRMIAQVPETRSYSKQHLEGPDQLLRLINEVLTMAPEFGDQNVTLPLGEDSSIGPWEPKPGLRRSATQRLNAALKKILMAWCDYLSSPESLYVLKRPTLGLDQRCGSPGDRHRAV